MKKFLCIFLLILVSCSIKIQVGTQITLEKSFDLICSGAKGEIKFQAQNLPPGVRIVDSRLQIFDFKRTIPGFYPIKIKVFDSFGATDEKKIIVTLKNSETNQIISQSNFNALQNPSSQFLIISVSETKSNMPNNMGPISLPGSLKFSNNAGYQQNVQFNPNAQGSAPPTAAQTDSNLQRPQSSPSNGEANNINSILKQLQIPQNVGGKSPELQDLKSTLSNLPRGADSSLINPNPQMILDAKATRSPTNRRIITPDDIKTRAAFTRQSNAGLAIGNLLAIVKQATANKNVAQEQFIKRQDIFNQIKKKVQSANNNSSKSENDYSRLSLGLKSVLQTINQAKSKIDQLNTQSKSKFQQKQAINGGIASSQNKLNSITTELAQAQKQYNLIKQEKQAKDMECYNLQKEQNSIQSQREKRIKDMTEISTKLIPAAKRKLDFDRQTVNDIKQKLAKAEADAAESQRALNDLQNSQKDNTNFFAGYEIRTADLRSRVLACPNGSKQLSERLKMIQIQLLNRLNSDKMNASDQIKALGSNLQKLNSQLVQIPKQLQVYKQQIAQLQPKVAILRQQITLSQKKVIDQKGANDDANDQLNNARLALEAAKNRYETQAKTVQSATRNLQLARIQKQNADQEVEALIREGANVQPFANADAIDNTQPPNRSTSPNVSSRNGDDILNRNTPVAINVNSNPNNFINANMIRNNINPNAIQNNINPNAFAPIISNGGPVQNQIPISNNVNPNGVINNFNPDAIINSYNPNGVVDNINSNAIGNPIAFNQQPTMNSVPIANINNSDYDSNRFIKSNMIPNAVINNKINNNFINPNFVQNNASPQILPAVPLGNVIGPVTSSPLNNYVTPNFIGANQALPLAPNVNYNSINSNTVASPPSNYVNTNYIVNNAISNNAIPNTQPTNNAPIDTAPSNAFSLQTFMNNNINNGNMAEQKQTGQSNLKRQQDDVIPISTVPIGDFPIPTRPTPILASNQSPQTPVNIENKQLLQQSFLNLVNPNNDGSYQIKTVSQIVLALFGQDIKAPASISSTTLYPVFSKPANSKEFLPILPPVPTRSLMGYVVSVKEASFGLLSDNGTIFQVEYAPSMKFYAFQPNYKLEAGKKVIIRAVPKSDDIITAILIMAIPE